MELLCCGKLLGIRKWASLYSSKLLGFRDLRKFESWQAIGDLQTERPPKALHYRQAIGDSESIQRRSKSFTFQQAIGDSQSMKLLSCGQAIGHLQVECLLKVLQCFFMSNKVFLIGIFFANGFPSFVHRRVQRSFCFFRAGFVLGPTLPPSLPAWLGPILCT